jgi:hypothetical protein
MYYSFFVGEFYESKPQCPFEVDVQRIAAFELAKPDPSYRRGRKGWDKTLRGGNGSGTGA